MDDQLDDMDLQTELRDIPLPDDETILCGAHQLPLDRVQILHRLVRLRIRRDRSKGRVGAVGKAYQAS